MKTHTASFTAAIALLVATAGGCAPDDDGCDRWCEDNHLAYGILDTVSFLWNQNLAGHPAGAQDLTVDCSLGGTAHISGQTSFDDGTQINSVDLLFDLAGCGHSGSGYDLKLTGVLHWSGTFSPSGFTAMTTSSDTLEFEGTVGESSETDVDDTCEVSLSVQGDDGETATVDGEICGREVGY